MKFQLNFLQLSLASPSVPVGASNYPSWSCNLQSPYQRQLNCYYNDAPNYHFHCHLLWITLDQNETSPRLNKAQYYALSVDSILLGVTSICDKLSPPQLLRAYFLQRACKIRVHVGVIVNLVPEGDAPSKSDGVAAGENHQVFEV